MSGGVPLITIPLNIWMKKKDCPLFAAKTVASESVLCSEECIATI